MMGVMVYAGCQYSFIFWIFYNVIQHRGFQRWICNAQCAGTERQCLSERQQLGGDRVPTALGDSGRGMSRFVIRLLAWLNRARVPPSRQTGVASMMPEPVESYSALQL